MKTKSTDKLPTKLPNMCVMQNDCEINHKWPNKVMVRCRNKSKHGANVFFLFKSKMVIVSVQFRYIIELNNLPNKCTPRTL